MLWGGEEGRGKGADERCGGGEGARPYQLCRPHAYQICRPHTFPIPPPCISCHSPDSPPPSVPQLSHMMPAGKVLNFTALLPSNRTYVTYPGSLTTPPCTEGVMWHVLTTPQTISLPQVCMQGGKWGGRGGHTLAQRAHWANCLM